MIAVSYTHLDVYKRQVKESPYDGKIYGVIYSHYLCRLNANGSIDNSFGTNGIVNLTGTAFDFIFQSSGKIVVAERGQGFIMERFNADGTIDNSFLNNVSYTDSLVGGIHYSNGLKLYEYGSNKKINMVIRYESFASVKNLVLIQTDENGMPDISYGIYGYKTVSTLSLIHIQMCIRDRN